MQDSVKKTWTNLVQPLLYRPPHEQVAALCVKGKGKDRKVLLVTSRGSGRWIIPKGWPMQGKTDAEAAAQEAWEEAGVRTHHISPEPIGQYRYTKELSNGIVAPIQARVYLIKVDSLSKAYPEARQRRRKWFRPKEAAQKVQEMALKDLLLNL